jgi:hypothetical protein
MVTTTARRSRPILRLALGAGVIAAMAAASVVGLLVGPEHRVDSGDLVFLAIEVAAGILVWAAVMWLDREPDGANRAAAGAVGVGILGVVSTVAFWFGIAIALGVGAVLLGRDGLARAEGGAGRRTVARIGLVLGIVALGLWAAAYALVQDW